VDASPPAPDEIRDALQEFVASRDRSLQSIAGFEVLTGLACVVRSLAKRGGDAADPNERASAFLDTLRCAIENLGDDSRKAAAKAYFDIDRGQARARTLTERRHLAARALRITPEQFHRRDFPESEGPLLTAVADLLFQLDREARTTADGRELRVGRRSRRLKVIIGALVAIAAAAAGAVTAILISRDGGGPSPPARIVLEAENAVTRAGLVRQRSRASGDATVLLQSGQSLTLSVPRGLEGSYTAVIRYSNDQGRNDFPGEIVGVAGATTSDLEAMSTGDWNRFFKHDITLGLKPDRSTIRISVSGGDRLGIEIDEVTLRRNEHD
jgi:hypothetical protein